MTESSTERCNSIIYCELPDSLKIIDENAFSGCKRLEHVTLPNSIREIKERAFEDCAGLRTVIIPDSSLISIESQAFQNCSLLTSINLSSDRLEYVGDNAFDGCPAKLSKAPYHDLNIDAVHYHCDLNRGGRKFLMRRNDNGNGNGNNDDDNKAYPPSLWPLILHRVINEMTLPTCRIRQPTTTRTRTRTTSSHDNDGNNNNNNNDSTSNNNNNTTDEYTGYTDSTDRRRATIVYFLMTNGITMEYTTTTK